MSGEALGFQSAPRLAPAALRKPKTSAGVLGAYAAALGLVAVASLIGFLVQHLIASPDVTLVFVLPVVIAATTFGFGPALAAAVSGVLAFDFFFTAPFFSFRIHSADDLWAAALLLVIAAIVSTLAAEARGRALEARREAGRAGALHDLAHLVVQSAPAAEVARSSAEALAKIFQAPAAVLIADGGMLKPAALTEGASLSPADLEAANWTLASQTPSHGDNYPFAASTFDFWPIRRDDSPDLVLGVRCGDTDARPEHPAKYVELAGAYLAASLTAPAHRR
ncbi:DUF4118 domain-containing protein [Phenylobacterium sp. LjRoot219]|uniref:DUF4118 domain-containing protein n=1 Tax=Phenylobacterium sp. LjRoot219 TaxID=3342283 RepID=UPI003ECDD6E0